MLYICSGDETEMSNAEDQLIRDKSPGDEVIRFKKAELYGSAFLFGITLEPFMPEKTYAMS